MWDTGGPIHFNSVRGQNSTKMDPLLHQVRGLGSHGRCLGPGAQRICTRTLADRLFNPELTLFTMKMLFTDLKIIYHDLSADLVVLL